MTLRASDVEAPLAASLAGGTRLRLRGLAARTIARTVDAPATVLDDRAWLAAQGDPSSAPTLDARADGNRGAIVEGHGVEHAGRSWLLAVKGVGARAPLYGDSPAGFAFEHDLDLGAALDARPLLSAVTRESWMGEAPYGGQGLEGALHALSLSQPALREALAPCVLCPTIAVVEIPEEEIRDVFHYRRHRGPVVQEHRLVPSAVRLFHQSALALGRDCEGTLAALGVETLAALEPFIDRFLASALALLTVGARSARVRGSALEMLDYDDAWLDKDAFVSPDGALAFADLEALVWTEVPDEAALGARIRRQMERNAYEVLYGLDALLRTEERWRERPRHQSERRGALATRTELATISDPTLEVVRSTEGCDLVITPRVGKPLILRWIDVR
ncbi:MAG: hypothetical protein OHK0013_40820 [Sandaracinaceae bacterium]